MFVVCNKHLEDAIDEFIEVYEQPPDIYELEKTSFTEWTAPAKCHCCDDEQNILWYSRGSSAFFARFFKEEENEYHYNFCRENKGEIL